MISSAVYSGVLRRCLPSSYNAREIKREEYVRLVLVSLLFIVNIVLGNVSIKYCSLALDQVPDIAWRYGVDCAMYYASVDGCRSVRFTRREAIRESVFDTRSHYWRGYDGLQGRSASFVAGLCSDQGHAVWYRRSADQLFCFNDQGHRDQAAVVFWKQAFSSATVDYCRCSPLL